MECGKKLGMLFEEFQRRHFPISYERAGSIATSKCVQGYEAKIDINSEISCNCMDIQETSPVTCRLFTSLHKNLFQSRGTLVDGPFTRCALTEPLRDRSTPLIEQG